MTNYNTEQYWDEVARQVHQRSDSSVIAGDDEPYYHYKRRRFLELFSTIKVEGKSVLEIGSGPGGNLDVLSRMNCRSITGVDISQNMIGAAAKLLGGKGVTLLKTDGIHLPFPENNFDLVFTSTVLQHNTDEAKLGKLVAEICRVSSSEVILFERIEKTIRGHETNLGRPLRYYEDLLRPHGFFLHECKFLPIQASYFACGVIRKLFNKRNRKEGEPPSRISILLQKVVLPFTGVLDKLVVSGRDVGMMKFLKRQK